ncbi:MAG TPA: SDR family NAD(P)-dependent oxidoreductase [Planctomycetaceae bacterium]|nr:SDR family NAD(P)-dependent oxidoreductase [Planctomycetaceae bacterium]
MRNVIVTGGSRGIGLGIARRLAKAGYSVTAIARRETPELHDAIAEATNSGTGAIGFTAYDLANTDRMPDLVKRICKDRGPVYALVNNAGMSIEGTLALTSAEQIEQVVRLNVTSPMLLSKAVLRSMMAEGAGGRIVNISSIMAFTGYAGLSVYGATKASMVGFTRSLAREVGRMNVTVNAVAPGFVETEMTSGLNEDQREQIARRSALRRLVEVDDVAAAVEYLLSDGAKNITGTVITVDAGNTA